MASVSAAIIGDVIWLRGDGLDQELHRRLAAIADGPVFELAANGQLTPFGAAVPIERMPDVDWEPVCEILRTVLPVSQMAHVQVARVRLTLERSSSEHDAALLVTDWPSFFDWALVAPEIRLQACRFAVCRETATKFGDSGALPHRVAIMGQPLPPLIGERFWLAGSLAVPLGFHWMPGVDVATAESVLANDTDDGRPRIRLWHGERNQVDEIMSSEWVPVTRANVRATHDGLNAGR